MARKRTSEPRKGNGGASTSAAPFAVPSWPATTPKLLPLREIVPYEKNPRTHPAEQISLLAKLMRQYGVDQPIVVDEDGVILKGHGRLLAAQEAGFETFPVVRHVGLSAADKKAIRVADNQVALLSGWDRELLRGEMLDLKTEGYDLPLLGFDTVTLDWMTGDGNPVLDPAGEWGGMPAFSNPDATAFRSIIVHFKDQEAVDLFAKTVGQRIGEKTRFLWYPVMEIKPFLKWGGDGEPAVSDLHRVEGKASDPVHEQGAGEDRCAVSDRGRGAGARSLRRGDRSKQDSRPR